MALALIVVRQPHELATQRHSILVVEQFARTSCPLPTRWPSCSMARSCGRGTPADLEDDLSSSYLGT